MSDERLTCEQLFDHLGDLIEGTLPAELEGPALEHLASCPSCEETLAGTRRLLELAAEPTLQLTAEDLESMRDRLLGDIG